MSKRLNWRRLFLLGGLALLLRIGYTIATGGDVAITGDAKSYDAFARLMISGWQWVTTPWAGREPLYPALMAFAYSLPGGDIPALQFVQGVLGALTAVIVYLTFRSATGEAVGLVAGILVAVNPHFVHISILPLRENLLVFLVACFLMAFFVATKNPRRLNLFVFSLVATLLVHTDARFLPLMIAIPLMIYCVNRSKSRALIQSLWIWLFLAALMTPYMIRGFVAFGKPVIIAERTLEYWVPRIEALLGGGSDTGQDTREDWLRDWEQEKRTKLNDLSAAEREFFLSGGRPALAPLRVHWFLFLEYWRFTRLEPDYRPYPDGRFTPPWSAQHNLSGMVVMIPFFFLLPFVWLRRRGVERSVALALTALLVAHMVLHVLVHARARYRLPIEVITSALSGIGIVILWSLVKERLTIKRKH